MKKFGFGIVAAILASAPAFAADLPSTKAAPVYAPPPPAFSWTGFYVGLNVGGGWFENYNRTGWGAAYTPVGFVPANVVAVGSTGPGGVVGGVTGGYNFQMTPMFTIGLEADFQGSAIGQSNSWGAGGTRQVEDFGTVRGRVGLSMPGWSQLMVYGTGGFAYGDVRLNQGWLGSVGASSIGWSAGGGVEYAFLPNWSVKAEYLYTDIGARNWGGFYLSEQRVHFNTVRAGLNYRLNFSNGLPVFSGL